MNPVVLGQMRSFLASHELDDRDQGLAFEQFAAFCLLNAEGTENQAFLEILTGDGEEGIDAIGIIVNGQLVSSRAEFEEIVENSAALSVKYLFVQAKGREKWESGDVLKFRRSVEGFFLGGNIGSSAWIGECRKIHEAVMENASRLRENPSLRASYVTTASVPSGDGEFHAQKYLDELKEVLGGLAIFAQVLCDAVGAEEIQRLYRSATTAATGSINFSSKVTLPSIPKVEQAYLGLLPASELLRLISDADRDEIRKSVFEDNVRDYQGSSSPVNSKMAETLSSEARSRFAVMNNGITIVARDLRVTGDTLSLGDYQIVNGAQTSHVLFENRDRYDSSEVYIPAKLIQTKDEDLITDIVTATNSQTVISVDQLNARAIAERNIEKFFAATESPRNLLYERRSRQYDSQSDVVKARVVDRMTLLRAMAATFADEPNIATGYSQQLINRIEKSGDQVRRRFLQDRDEPCVYYAAASAYYRLDLFFKTGRLEAKFKPARWYVLALARRSVLPDAVPPYADRKIREWVQPFIEAVWDENQALEMFQGALNRISDSGVELSRRVFRNASTAADLLKL